MRPASTLIAALAVLAFAPATGAAQPLVLTGDVPAGPETHFFIDFEVPAGIVEIEVRHDDLSEANILDFGLDDPNGFRGWGGGNTEPAVVGVDAASRSYVPGPIPAGTWRVVVGKAKITEPPGSYQVEIDLRTTPTLAPQPERQPYLDPGVLDATAGWYPGDLHVHSRESGDARPSLEELAVFAESQGLRFIEISDHNTNTSLDFFREVQARHPSLLLLPGVEFTTYAGHANGIGATEWVNHRIGVEGATIEGAVDAFHAQGALFSLNHPALAIGDLCIGCSFEHELPPEMIDAVEIMTTSTAAVQLAFMKPAIARWDALCAAGAHAAAIGGSDDHEGGQGTGSLASPVGHPTTLVYAEELSVAGILEGIRRGRTVVKITGPDAPMAALDASDPLDGDTVRAQQTTLLATVTGGLGDEFHIIKNGEALGAPLAIDADPFHYELPVDAPSTGEDRYRLEVRTPRSLLTLTSHVYITLDGAPDPVPPTVSGGGGCAVSSGNDGSLGLFLSLALLLSLAWRARSSRLKA